MRVDVTSDPRWFLDEGADFLLSDPVVNSVLLSNATNLAALPDPDAAPAAWALLREDETAANGSVVLGAAMRTPPRGIVISRLPAGGAATLTEALLPTCADAPTVGGPAPDVEEFAQLWSSRLGRGVTVGIQQRIYQLDRVFPVTGVSGRPRKARTEDLDTVVAWTLNFNQDIAEPGGSPTAERVRAVNERKIDQGLIHIWDDDGPVSLVGTTPAVGGIVRIGPVYTPAEHRARGYASALTAAVSRQALRNGADACSLYTDLANPTSNQIYAAIGYRPLCDATVYLVRSGS